MIGRRAGRPRGGICIEEPVNCAAGKVRRHRRRSRRVLVIPRKEVIQPQVLLRLPCYDLVPVTGLTVGRRPLAVG